MLAIPYKDVTSRTGCPVIAGMGNVRLLDLIGGLLIDRGDLMILSNLG